MAMSEQQKNLRRWFQRHGWHTADTPTGTGVYLETPVQNSAGLAYMAVDPNTGKRREYAKEAFAAIELDRFGCEYITLSIFERKHWWKRDMSVPDGTWRMYSWVPSDDFEDWKRDPDASVSIPARDILKLAELIQEAQKDYCRVRKRKYSPRLFSSLKNCLVRWIGVNSSYEKIKWTYSNERLRQERQEKEGEA